MPRPQPDVEITADERFERLAADARRKPLREIAKQEKLISNLENDLAKHGDPELWKRYGDLLLANVGNAVRRGDKIEVIDYFDEAAPTIEIEGKTNLSISEIAEGYFRRYTKARNGLSKITERIEVAKAKISELRGQLALINIAIYARDEAYLLALIAPKKPVAASRPKKKSEKEFKGARRFVSSDGLEILVGKKAADNDYLTFRIARSLDLWLHAADYPGSHVVVRVMGRKEVPHQTLIEAAQLAAFYSDARSLGKASVRYALKKFVNKPKRSAPGLVSLANFKTIVVEPKVAVAKAED